MDIIARDGQTMVFVEVKAREGAEFGQPGEAVTGWKRRRIVDLAMDYLVRHRLLNRPCRFDVVAIRVESGTPMIQVYQNAFDSSGVR